MKMPAPRFKLFLDTILVDDFFLTSFKGGKDAPPYLRFKIETLTHELDPDTTRGELVKKKWGFRLIAQMYFPTVGGEELQKLNQLLDIRKYTSCQFYPMRVDAPGFYVTAHPTNDSLGLGYMAAIMHVNFTLRVQSDDLLPTVPLGTIL
jgi:hypothetical protein